MLTRHRRLAEHKEKTDLNVGSNKKRSCGEFIKSNSFQEKEAQESNPEEEEEEDDEDEILMDFDQFEGIY